MHIPLVNIVSCINVSQMQTSVAANTVNVCTSVIMLVSGKMAKVLKMQSLSSALTKLNDSGTAVIAVNVMKPEEQQQERAGTD